MLWGGRSSVCLPYHDIYHNKSDLSGFACIRTRRQCYHKDIASKDEGDWRSGVKSVESLHFYKEALLLYTARTGLVSWTQTARNQIKTKYLLTKYF